MELSAEFEALVFSARSARTRVHIFERDATSRQRSGGSRKTTRLPCELSIDFSPSENRVYEARVFSRRSLSLSPSPPSARRRKHERRKIGYFSMESLEPRREPSLWQVALVTRLNNLIEGNFVRPICTKIQNQKICPRKALGLTNFRVPPPGILPRILPLPLPCLLPNPLIGLITVRLP